MTATATSCASTLRLRLAASDTVTPYAELRFLGPRLPRAPGRSRLQPRHAPDRRDRRRALCLGQEFPGPHRRGALRAAFDDPDFADFTSFLAEGELTWFLGEDTALTDGSIRPKPRPRAFSARRVSQPPPRSPRAWLYPGRPRLYRAALCARPVREPGRARRDAGLRPWPRGDRLARRHAHGLLSFHRQGLDTFGESFERNAFTFGARFGF